MIRIGVLGESGRMGKWVVQLLETEYKKKAKLVSTAGRKDRIESLLKVDVVIEFSSTTAMLTLARATATIQSVLPAFVVGSTGWKADELQELTQLAERTPVLHSANFSMGMLALQEILKQANPVLQKLGYTPVLVEAHHQHKKDAPSGTAKSIQKILSPQSPNSVQTHCIRAGEVIGEHNITFFGSADKITLGHAAQDRSVFARGAIEAALWIAEKRSGRKAIRGLIGMDEFFQERLNLK